MRREISGDMVVGSHGKTVNAIAIAFILSAESNKLILLFDFQSYLSSLVLSWDQMYKKETSFLLLSWFSLPLSLSSRFVSCETRWSFINFLCSFSCSSHVLLFLHGLFLSVPIQVSDFFLLSYWFDISSAIVDWCNILFFDGFSGAPSEVNSTLSFCPYKGKTCCNTMKDTSLMKQFQAMNISDKGCASVVKSILCAVSIISVFNP